MKRCGLILTFILAVETAFAAKIPFRWLRIDHHHWEVRQAHKIGKMASGIGYTFCQQRVIVVVDYLGAWETAKVLLHEIQHGMVCVEGFDRVENDRFNNDDESDEHDGIYFASPQWMWVIHDNPWLVKWIGECEPPA